MTTFSVLLIAVSFVAICTGSEETGKYAIYSCDSDNKATVGEHCSDTTCSTCDNAHFGVDSGHCYEIDGTVHVVTCASSEATVKVYTNETDACPTDGSALTGQFTSVHHPLGECELMMEDHIDYEEFGSFTCNNDGTIDFVEHCTTASCDVCEVSDSSVADGHCYLVEGKVHTVSCVDASAIVSVFHSASTCPPASEAAHTNRTHQSGVCEAINHDQIETCTEKRIELAVQLNTGVCAQAEELGRCTAACQAELDSVCDSCSDGDEYGVDTFDGLSVWAGYGDTIPNTNCVPADCYYSSAGRTVLTLFAMLSTLVYML